MSYAPVPDQKADRQRRALVMIRSVAARLMEEVVALDENGRKALNKLRRLIEEKNLVSYSGEIYHKKDIERMWKLLERYRNWAVEMLGI